VSTSTKVMTAKLIATSPQQAQLSGCLDRVAGKELLEQGRRLIANSGGRWQVDLSDVSHSSSVGIALLLDWLRYGKGKKTSIEFLHVPQKMRQVIEFSGLSAVFNLN
jgi:phospholipid transport system transporter-binding protein